MLSALTYRPLTVSICLISYVSCHKDKPWKKKFPSEKISCLSKCYKKVPTIDRSFLFFPIFYSKYFLRCVESYQCPGGETEETTTVNNKAKLTFTVPKKTPHNMNCQANYVMGTCSEVKLVCNFKMKGTGKTCLGDKAVITYGTKTST